MDFTLFSADPGCESVLQLHAAEFQSPGRISIPTRYRLSSDQTRCCEMLDLVYEAITVFSAATRVGLCMAQDKDLSR